MEAGLSDGLQQVDLAALVRAEVARRADRVAVRVRSMPGVTVNAVPTQIRRALANLLDNAQRYAEQTVEVHVARKGECAILSVVDDGPGIAEADRERVFQRFVRLDARDGRGGKGSGLGLAIASDIAQAHFGTLRVEDSTAGGARFVLGLPLAGAAHRAHPAAC
jgi:signal transduction histidine kinase